MAERRVVHEIEASLVSFHLETQYAADIAYDVVRISQDESIFSLFFIFFEASSFHFFFLPLSLIALFFFLVLFMSQYIYISFLVSEIKKAILVVRSCEGKQGNKKKEEEDKNNQLSRI